MKITVVCVGKVKEAFFRDLIQMHSVHLQKKCAFSICQLADLPIGRKAGEQEQQRIKLEEGRQILRKINKEAYVIALCIEGREMTPAVHRKLICDIRDSGFQELVYVIGGSLGLSQEVIQRADARMSFSRMTFPHQLMRVMLLEVIDRDYL